MYEKYTQHKHFKLNNKLSYGAQISLTQHVSHINDPRVDPNRYAIGIFFQMFSTIPCVLICTISSLKSGPILILNYFLREKGLMFDFYEAHNIVPMIFLYDIVRMCKLYVCFTPYGMPRRTQKYFDHKSNRRDAIIKEHLQVYIFRHCTSMPHSLVVFVQKRGQF